MRTVTSTYGNVPEPVIMAASIARMLNLPRIPFERGKPVPLKRPIPNILVCAYEQGIPGFQWFYWPLS